MSNPYGITLDREWSEWAAKFGASPTVAAALFLISERHPSLEVIAKLTLGEVEEVAAIVRRWPDCFPPGSLDALKCRSQTLAQPPSVRVSADPTSRRRPARVSAESLHRRAYTRRFEHVQGAGMLRSISRREARVLVVRPGGCKGGDRFHPKRPPADFALSAQRTR